MGKTGNHSIRFDEEKLAFFQKLYPGITKPQQIVDELFNHFYYSHPPLWFTLDDKQIPPPAGTPVTIQPPVSTKEFVVDFKPAQVVSKYENYKKEILEAPSPKNVEAIAFIIKADKELLPLEKNLLHQFAVEHSRTFEF